MRSARLIPISLNRGSGNSVRSPPPFYVRSIRPNIDRPNESRSRASARCIPTGHVDPLDPRLRVPGSSETRVTRAYVRVYIRAMRPSLLKRRRKPTTISRKDVSLVCSHKRAILFSLKKPPLSNNANSPVSLDTSSYRSFCYEGKKETNVARSI